MKVLPGFEARGSAFAFVCALLFACCAAACAHVAPHEREALAKPAMDRASEAQELGFEAHVRETREGSTSAAGAAGGGCGCN